MNHKLFQYMPTKHFTEFRLAFQRELQLWKPSDQDFKTSLVKAQIHFNGPDVALTIDEFLDLQDLFDEASAAEQ